jgi:hypothetical protein
MAEPGKATRRQLNSATHALVAGGGAITLPAAMVVNDGPVRLLAVVLDSRMRPFEMSDLTTFAFLWTTDHPEVTLDEATGGAAAAMWVGNATGLLRVHVQVASMGFSPETPPPMIRVMKATLAARKKALSDGVLLDVVSALSLPPTLTLGLNMGTVRFAMSGGSHRCLVYSNNTGVVTVAVNMMQAVTPDGKVVITAMLEVTPHALGSAPVTAHDPDTGLVSVMLVTVTGIASIKVSMEDKRMKVGEVKDAEVEVFGANGAVLHPSSYEPLQVKGHLHDMKVEIVGPLHVVDGKAYLPVEAKAIGASSFHVTAHVGAHPKGGNAKALRSPPLHLILYHPISLLTGDVNGDAFSRFVAPL